MQKIISSDIVVAYSHCPRKAFLLMSGEQGVDVEYVKILKQKRFLQKSRYIKEIKPTGSDIQIDKLNNTKKYGDTLVSVSLKSEYFEAGCDILTRAYKVSSIIKADYEPTIFIGSHNVGKEHKLELAFVGHVLGKIEGQIPEKGTIVSADGKSHGLKLKPLLNSLQKIVSPLQEWLTFPTSQPPQVILNKHCSLCEYQMQCHQIAAEKDELTLLSGLTEKERKRQNNKGIFTIMQLSYTFRARRRPKHLVSKPGQLSHALRALAIREHKIYIAGKPKLNTKGTLVFLDVEGNPELDFYYLIGLRIMNGDSYVQHSFWANEKADEKNIWVLFLGILAKIDNPQLIYYGHYEKVFLKKMKERYTKTSNDALLVDQISAESINLLSVIYSQIYFPTYSNGLKDIAQYLGFHWSDDAPSGLNALTWRALWESSKNPDLKQKLITYNAEDCEALERVMTTILKLCQKQTNNLESDDNSIVYTDRLKKESPYHFGPNDFSMPELEYINQTAYWHYQRDRIYVKSNQLLKHIQQNKARARIKPLPINKVVALERRPLCCAKCKATKIYKYGQATKIVYDLNIKKTGIKRWIIKYCFNRYICWKCKSSFYAEERPWMRSKYGSELRSYVIYQIIELRLAQRAVAQSLNRLFSFALNAGSIQGLKTEAAQIYETNYENILSKILAGKLLHADETKVDFEGKEGFVWVITNLEEVIYFYTETRAGDTIQAMLKEFKGVLVSDFYAVYDAFDCPQQKCLIHLIRDLNGDLLKHPFNVELSELAHNFALLLKAIVETVDRFGLKTRFLRKHKISVERFYKKLSICKYESEIALYYKKRFDKNHDKLFTFLDYDGIPWNNNNAEHAIKSFARLRNVIGGTSSDKGIREYLTLLSISETCNYKGISFMDFLRSGEKDIDIFING